MSTFAPSPSAPATTGVAVTKSDSTNINKTRALYVATGGDLKVRFADNTDVTFPAVPGGSVLSVAVIRVWSTGTTADNIVALY
jgi:hypothetical protein